MTSRATRSRSRGASAADPPAPPRSRSKTPSPAVVAKKVPRSRSRSKSDTKSTPKPAPPKPASANAKPPKSPNLYSQLLNLLLPRRKQFQLYPLAFISALLHFLALANAFLGALSWFNKPLSGEFDFDLIAYGFYAYTFDVTTAFICGRSFFYRWTRLDVFIHHLPFMFVGGFWALATYDILHMQNLVRSISFFQQAVRWAMLSCSNEFALALGAALRSDEELWARRLSTWAGLIYFLVFSPIWIVYVMSSCYYGGRYNWFLWLNTAVPILYAVTQYPLYIKVYNKRLKKLYEIESYKAGLKKMFRKEEKAVGGGEKDFLVNLAKPDTWNVRTRMIKEVEM